MVGQAWCMDAAILSFSDSVGACGPVVCGRFPIFSINDEHAFLRCHDVHHVPAYQYSSFLAEMWSGLHYPMGRLEDLSALWIYWDSSNPSLTNFWVIVGLLDAVPALPSAIWKNWLVLLYSWPNCGHTCEFEFDIGTMIYTPFQLLITALTMAIGGSSQHI